MIIRHRRRIACYLGLCAIAPLGCVDLRVEGSGGSGATAGSTVTSTATAGGTTSGSGATCQLPPSVGTCQSVGGLYCGGDPIGGDPAVLYKCHYDALTIDR